ncbi:hypothetical protein BOSEA31B_20292 [Hyphomicrobiales bacterium]|jgi:hypothetical protein|nr:hypothetical protein BOSEA31B_20292 [Hyphomicrobiales bacterium]CAH1702334.1 hypothetical protein BOSEA1005_30206 [Hyphomicrobiales bacterium]CAI0346535.1 hypothetical protein BO1005MUT1_520047 [Hyphomicrobiales bacterium]
MSEWKLLPVEPTDAMLDALADETPYCVRRASDKSCYEVIFNPAEDWRTHIPNDLQIVFQGAEAEAEVRCERLRRLWLYRSLLATAPEPPANA